MTSRTCNGKCNIYGIPGPVKTKTALWYYCNVCESSFTSVYEKCPCCGEKLYYTEKPKKEDSKK